MNRAFIHGNVGKDPEIKKIGENKVAKFSLATQSFRKDENNNKVTDWHNIVAWGRLADLIEKYVTKESSLIVEGEIQYRNYTDKEGNKKYFTEISASAIHFTGKKEPEQPGLRNNPDNSFEAKDEYQGGKKQTSSMSNIDDLFKPEITDGINDLPY